MDLLVAPTDHRNLVAEEEKVMLNLSTLHLHRILLNIRTYRMDLLVVAEV
jgi:hypothetical protein